MPDKHCERYDLAALRRALPELPPGAPEEHEPPDFVLKSGGHRLGIEFTTFHYPAPPGAPVPQEQQALQERIVALAERLHRHQGGCGLYAHVHFLPQLPLRKRDTRRLAESLAEAVHSFGKVEPLQELTRLDPTFLPAGIASIGVFGSVDGVDSLWQAGSGGWVAPVTPGHVQSVVARKARRAGQARARCDELWLVVVSDEFAAATPAELTQEAIEADYHGPFDRLYWLVPHVPQAVRLELSADPVYVAGV